MALIEPFSLQPAGPWDASTAYWWATALRLSYHPGQLGRWNELAALADGGTAFEVSTPDSTGLVPRVFSTSYPALHRIIALEGTARPQQWAAHAVGANLTVWEGSGRVGTYTRAAALAVWAVVAPLVAGRTWAVCGHSFGGQVGALLPQLAGANPPAIVVDAGAPRSGDLEYASAQVVTRLRMTGQGDPVPAVPPSTSSLLDELPAFVPGWIDLGPVFYRHWGSRVHLHDDGTLMRPGESQVLSEAATLARAALTPTAALPDHRVTTYARRVRAGIPVPFPAAAPDVDFPALPQLDALNLAVNELDGIEWVATAAPIPPAAPVFVAPLCE